MTGTRVSMSSSFGCWLVIYNSFSIKFIFKNFKTVFVSAAN